MVLLTPYQIANQTRQNFHNNFLLWHYAPTCSFNRCIKANVFKPICEALVCGPKTARSHFLCPCLHAKKFQMLFLIYKAARKCSCVSFICNHYIPPRSDRKNKAYLFIHCPSATSKPFLNKLLLLVYCGLLRSTIK